jgi:tetratricopeptide (TPR) repeat protein
MVFQIESFPDIILEGLAYILEPNDLFQLALTSKQLYQVFMANNLWKSKTLHDFGDLFQIYTIFTTATGFTLDSALTEKFSHEPENWRHYYMKKNKSSTENDVALMDQADTEYAHAQTQLESFQQDGNVETLVEVAGKMMWILDVFPSHAGCYYILAFILFVLNKLEEAMILLQMGRAVDPNFEPIDGKHIQNLKRKFSIKHVKKF